MTILKRSLWILPFFVLPALLLYQTFLGYSIQGVDGSLGWMKMLADQLPHSIQMWDDRAYWLGNSITNVIPNFFFFFLRFLPTEMVMSVFLFTIVSLAMVFMYLFLRRIRLDRLPAVLGAVSWGLTPHIITLVPSGHIMAFDFMPLPPLALYCAAVLLDKTTPLWKKAAAIVTAGAVIGLIMQDDPQRGLGFSLVIGFTMLYFIFRNNDLKLSDPAAAVKSKNFWFDMIKLVIVIAVSLGAFYSALNTQFKNIRERQALTEQSAEQRWQFATSLSHHPFDLIDSLAFGFHGASSGDQELPYWGGKEFSPGNPFSMNSESLGFFTLVLAVIAMIFLFLKNGLARLYTILGLFSLLLAFGQYFPGTPFFWIWHNLPIMGYMRVPSKWIAITSLCFSILAAFGLSYILESARQAYEKGKKHPLNSIIRAFLIGSGIGIIGIFVVISITPGLSDILPKSVQGVSGLIGNNMAMALLRMTVFFGLSAGLIVFLKKFGTDTWKASAAAFIFIALGTFDFLTVNWFYINKAYFKAEDIYRADGVVLFAKSRPEPVRYATSLYVPNGNDPAPYPVTGLRQTYLTYHFLYFGIQAMDVPAISVVMPEYRDFMMTALKGSITKQIQTYADLADANIRLLSLSAVNYVLADGDLGTSNLVPAEQVAGLDGRKVLIYQNTNALPRLALFDSYISMTNLMGAMQYLASPSFNYKGIAVVNAPGKMRLAGSNDCVAMTVTSNRTGYIAGTINAPSGGFVLHVARYSPDWKALVNGKPSQVYEANGIQMGTFVEPGNHTVEFIYQPSASAFWVSFIFILSGLVALAAMGVSGFTAMFRKE